MVVMIRKLHVKYTGSCQHAQVAERSEQVYKGLTAAVVCPNAQ